MIRAGLIEKVTIHRNDVHYRITESGLAEPIEGARDRDLVVTRTPVEDRAEAHALLALLVSRGPMRPKEIADSLEGGLSYRQVYYILRALERAGRIEAAPRPYSGAWQISSTR